MKTTLLALILVVALSTKPLSGAKPLPGAKPQPGAANASPEHVVDTSGKKVRAGVNYYVIPAWSSGGLALASTGDDCPLDVVAVDGYQGLPLRFVPVNAKKGDVRVNTDLNIVFSAETNCPQSTVWQLDNYDYSTGHWFVTTGGVVGNPGWQTIRDWFKIEEYDGAYKLVYCPSVCPTCRYQCRDIGIYEDEYGKRLALSDVPFKVQFQKA